MNIHNIHSQEDSMLYIIKVSMHDILKESFKNACASINQILHHRNWVFDVGLIKAQSIAILS